MKIDDDGKGTSSCRGINSRRNLPRRTGNLPVFDFADRLGRERLPALLQQRFNGIRDCRLTARFFRRQAFNWLSACLQTKNLVDYSHADTAKST